MKTSAQWVPEPDTGPQQVTQLHGTEKCFPKALHEVA